MSGHFKYYPTDMDHEMIPICNALNAFPGVRTFFSCSGHGRKLDDFYISMGISNIKSLKKILKCFDIYKYKRNMPEGAEFYILETDGVFWPLKNNEINLRISNHWINCLDANGRNKEFKRIIRLLRRARQNDRR